MSGDDHSRSPTPPPAAPVPTVVLDAATSDAIKSIVREQLRDALADLRPNVLAPPQRQIENPGAPARLAAAPDSEGRANRRDNPRPAAAREPRRGHIGLRSDAENPRAPAENPEDEDWDGGDEYQEERSPGDSYEPFTPEWYEERRNQHIALRFEIPRRFTTEYPVGFDPESIEHFRTFHSGGTSVGRATEASSLYCTAAYLSEASNDLTDLVNEIADALPSIQSESDREVFRRLGSRVSDAQLTTFGVYELAAARYEVLCGRQGASGVADPELLSAYIDPPAAFSSAGRQAYRRQQVQHIRHAAQAAGRRYRGEPNQRGGPGRNGAGRGGDGNGGGRRVGRRSRGAGRGHDI